MTNGRTFNTNWWFHWNPKWKALSISLTLHRYTFSGGIRLIWLSCDWAIGWWHKSHFPEGLEGINEE